MQVKKATCCRKRHHRSVLRAMKVYISMAAGGTGLHVYLCPVCGRFHLGGLKNKFEKWKARKMIRRLDGSGCGSTAFAGGDS